MVDRGDVCRNRFMDLPALSGVLFRSIRLPEGE